VRRQRDRKEIQQAVKDKIKKYSMKIYIFLLMTIFFSCSISNREKDRKILNNVLLCREDSVCYINAASKDFNNQVMVLYISGLIERGSFNDYYAIYLEKYRHINVIWGGDAFNPYLKFYNITMIDSIKSKYGESFFK
jgi:hypothetical protein